MFGIPNIWLIAGFIAILVAGVAMHEARVSSFRTEILTQERARVALASELLRNEERKRNAGITAEGERESLVEEREDAERERLLADANAKIAEMEKATPKCVIPREMVRQLNRGK